MIYLGVDTGGTFTDFVAVDAQGGDLLSFKIPSQPDDPAQAVRVGLERLHAQHGIAPRQIARLVFGTTVATNAVLEMKGAKTALITTRGTRDVLEIQRLWRARLFDLYLQKPPPLVPRRWRFEVHERIGADGSVVHALSEQELARIGDIVAEGEFDAVAVCCLFSFLSNTHEQRIRDAVGRRSPHLPISISCEVSPLFREYERTCTTVMNAYVMPAIRRLVARLETLLSELGCGAPLRIMQSNGGLMNAHTAGTHPVRTLLSGPAGGVVGAREVASRAGFDDIVTMDMGGTSLDVCMVRGGEVALSSEGFIGPYPVQVPQVNVHTIGAGGGSIARVIRGALKVGPLSAGAHPGPACYGRGGVDATCTDAALVLGTIDPNYFAGGDMILDAHAARQAVQTQVAEPLAMTTRQAAHAIIEVQVANMVTGIRAVSVERGLDARDFALLPFGGAGGLFAGKVADTLQMSTVLVPIQPGVLSALGMLLTDIKYTEVTTQLLDASCARPEQVEAILQSLQRRLETALEDEGVPSEHRHFAFACDMRYRGQAYEIAVPVALQPSGLDMDCLLARFHALHLELYAQNAVGEPVELVNFHAIATGRAAKPVIDDQPVTQGRTASPFANREVCFDGHEFVDTPVYRRQSLCPGAMLTGPAIVEEAGATTVVQPGHRVRVDGIGNLIITTGAAVSG